MVSRLRANAVSIVAAAIAIAVVIWLDFYGYALGDYDSEARPAFSALIGGHVGRALELAPAYGGSLVLRAPFALMPGLWGGGPLAVYRMAALPCLVAAAAVGIVIVGRMRRANRSRLARGVLLALFVANPITLWAGDFGHPEELLSGALAVGAVLVAGRGRSVWAGVLLGLAIVNKEWAIVAAGPVLLALPRGRVTALVVGGGVAAIVLTPLLLAGGGFATQLTAVGSLSSAPAIFHPTQVWWFLGSPRPAGSGFSGAAWAIRLSHPLIVVIGIPLTLLAARLPRREHRPMLLLALVLLLRAELDVWDTLYYLLPFVFALGAWEALAFERPPLAALSATAIAWVVFAWRPTWLTPDEVSACFLALALPATGWLALGVYARGRRSPAGVKKPAGDVDALAMVPAA